MIPELKLNSFVIIFLIIIIIFILLNFVNDSMKNKVVVYERFENNEIPKIIIQTWKTKAIPDKYKEDYDSLRKYNPKYQFLFFNDPDIKYFLQSNYPEYYKIYNKLPIIIQKIDFFRYVAVYHYGGFYFDLDMRCFMSLDKLLKYNCVFPIDLVLKKRCENTNFVRKRFKNYCENDMTFMVGQYAFGARPRHPFIKKLITTIQDNIDQYLEDFKINGDTLQYVYSTTGPDYVTDLYMEYDNKDDVHILDYPDGQHFGEYAVHNHYGTWK